MKRRIKRALVVFAAIIVCVVSFLFGSRLYRVETVITVESGNIPSTVVQESVTEERIETKFIDIVKGKSDTAIPNGAAQVEKRSTGTWTNLYATNLTKTDAKICGKVSFDPTATCIETGFYLGTSPEDLKKNKTCDHFKEDIESEDVPQWYFTMSEYDQKLKAGTTYYYKLYIIDKYGNEYTSDVKSFTTFK